MRNGARLAEVGAFMNRVIPTKALAAAIISLALAACGGRVAATGAGAGEVRQINAESLHARLASNEPRPLLVDVREPGEFDAGHIDGALLAPLGTVEDGVADVPKDREIILVCRSGNRSTKAYRRLAAAGYANLTNFDGGMLAWEKLGYPVVK